MFVKFKTVSKLFHNNTRKYVLFSKNKKTAIILLDYCSFLVIMTNDYIFFL